MNAKLASIFLPRYNNQVITYNFSRSHLEDVEKMKIELEEERSKTLSELGQLEQKARFV